MDTCKNIEPLLYLFRGDELTSSERARVEAHCQACANCREILAHLGLLEAGLLQYRSAVPKIPEEALIVVQTLRRIEGSPGRGAGRAASRRAEGVSDWLRPVFATLLIFAAMTLVVQISRDALRVHHLEAQLEVKGMAPGFAAESENPGLYELLELVSSFQKAHSPFSYRSESVQYGGQRFGPALEDAMNAREGLFDKFSAEYPRLSSITPQDGLDNNERSILKSDGMRFIREFEQFVRKGADKL